VQSPVLAGFTTGAIPCVDSVEAGRIGLGLAADGLPGDTVPASRPSFTIEFYEDAQGRKPVLRWIEKELKPTQRRALVAAMQEILAFEGVGVCGTELGRQLGHGLFEFRVRNPAEHLLLRVFCHAYGDKVVLLLAGYDKRRDPSRKRQAQEIERARKCLTDFRKRRIG